MSTLTWAETLKVQALAGGPCRADEPDISILDAAFDLFAGGGRSPSAEGDE